MHAITDIASLPDYRKALQRHKDVLQLADGLTVGDKKQLTTLYDAMIGTIDNIIARESRTMQDVRDIEVQNHTAII
ncbi:hypothetical protein [Flavobacterium sp.]|uniref:hypothetical protein n=1 Tax=Flavobacterium sp. TaxID=239 RepID=UPI004034E115